METAEKIENKNPLRVAAINNELINDVGLKTPAVTELPPLGSEKIIKEDIQKIKNQIDFLKNYNEVEEHLFDKDRPHIPLQTQLLQRETELIQFQETKKSFLKKIRNIFGL